MICISRQIMDYRGRTPKKLGMDWGGGDIPALSAGNVKMGFVDFNAECYFGSEALYSRWMTRGDVAKDDILFTTEAPLGNVALVPDDRQYILSQRTILLQVDPEKALSRFLFQMILSDGFQRMLADYSSGSTAKGIQRKKFEKLSVALPPLPEQREIAAAFSDVDALLGGLERLIAKKRDLKQAAMQQLLTGQTRLPGFHGKWIVKPLGELATIRDGTHQTPRYVSSGVPFYSVEHVTSGDFVSTKFISEEEHRFLTRSFKIERGDILMTRIGSIGNCKLIEWNVDASFYVSLALLKIRPQFSAAYVAQYSNTLAFKKQVELHSLASAIPKKINLGPISSINVELPSSFAEQTAIAAVLSDMDAELSALETRRDKTRALKQGMMQELLTGRIRLVAASSNAVPVDFATIPKRAPSDPKSHNWQFNEAVVVAVLVKQFGSEQYPLGRKRCTKLGYLMHRHVERVAQGYLKKAAGPYNPGVKYKGPETIAQKNGYIRPHTSGKFSGFVAAEKIAEAEGYFDKWYGREVLAWLEQFRHQTNNELELLATVDMAIVDLKRVQAEANVAAVKSIILGHPEWEAKLERAIFSDANIARAIGRVTELFAE